MELFELIIMLVELVLEVTLEVGVEATLSRRGSAERIPIAVLILVFSTIGAAVGLFSIFYFPSSALTTPLARWLNLLLTPVLVGVGTMLVANLRVRRGRPAQPGRSFVYGFVLAFSMAAIRFTLTSA